MITNRRVLSRHDEHAIAVKVVLDGAAIASGTKIQEGTLVLKRGNGKYTPAEAADVANDAAQPRVTKDYAELDGKDVEVAAYCEAYLNKAAISSATPAQLTALGPEVTSGEIRLMPK